MSASTLDDIYRSAVARFRNAELPTPELDARWLLADVAKLSARDIVLRARDRVSATTAIAFEASVARRLSGEPVDRILGSREFWSLNFHLNAATLSPRPDTETLVEACLGALPDRTLPWRLLDLGTGTGAILIALLHELPNAFGVGVDLAPEAVTQASRNAEANHVGERATFVSGDWGKGLTGPFDLIAANPPYIPAADVDDLAPEVRKHDPMLALVGGADGLEAYRAIAADAPRLLTPGGILAFELGIGQEAEVATIVAAAGLVLAGPARPDLGGVPRALLAHKPPA
jgi:release factor glutamine methyltransferase